MLVVLAEHTEWTQGNPPALLILVSLARKKQQQKNCLSGRQKAVQQPGSRQGGSILQRQRSVETAETCAQTHSLSLTRTHAHTHMQTVSVSEKGRSRCFQKSHKNPSSCETHILAQENNTKHFIFFGQGWWMMKEKTSGEEIVFEAVLTAEVLYF